jgi:flavoprotein
MSFEWCPVAAGTDGTIAKVIVSDIDIYEMTHIHQQPCITGPFWAREKLFLWFVQCRTHGMSFEWCLVAASTDGTIAKVIARYIDIYEMTHIDQQLCITGPFWAREKLFLQFVQCHMHGMSFEWWPVAAGTDGTIAKVIASYIDINELTHIHQEQCITGPFWAREKLFLQFVHCPTHGMSFEWCPVAAGTDGTIAKVIVSNIEIYEMTHIHQEQCITAPFWEREKLFLKFVQYHMHGMSFEWCPVAAGTDGTIAKVIACDIDI